MFTGIIQSVGRVAALEPCGGDVRITLDVGTLAMDDVKPGDSIAVNGVCLTAVVLTAEGFAADVSRESLGVTTLGALGAGSRVNLEKALTLGAPLGGHLVSGHVDGLGRVVGRRDDARSVRFSIEAPAELARYIAPKGSICVDGASLTVNEVDGCRLELNIIPHTVQETIMGEYREGDQVNLEVDLIARYLERLLLGDKAAQGSGSGISEDFLAQHGFLR